MKKQISGRSRRGVARRSVGFSLFILIGMSTILGFASQIITPQVAHAASAEENDLKRRKLHTLAECVSVKFINESNHTVKVWDDVFDKSNLSGDGQTYMNTREIIVVGLDREDDNGLMTCNSAIKEGVLALNPSDLKGTSENDIRNWFMLKVMGNNLDKTGGKSFTVNRSKLAASTLLATLQTQIKIEENKIASPNAQLQQQRYFPLAQICYEGFKEADTDKQLKNNAESFRIPGVGYFYRKSSEEVQKAFLKAGFIKKSGITPVFKESVGFGDLNLEFTSERGATNDFNVGSNDFYPIGTDIAKTRDYKFNAVVDCGFIYNNRDIALGGVTLSSSGKITPPDGITNTADSIGAGDTDIDDTNEACGGGSGGGALRWILCPVVNAINEGIKWATDEVIEPALKMSPLESGGTLYEAWKGIRNVANAFLVLIFLVIIFANFFASNNSSYTIKKALPRIIAAAILIQFSYFFCAVIIDIGNVLGNGIGVIVQQAVGGSAGGSGASAGADIASTLLTATIAGGGAAIAIMSGGWVLLFPIAIGLVISIITLFVTLGVRVIAINLLIMLSPIALLAWILPNTEKYADTWTKNFLKLVMMYPLIILVLSAAQVVVKVGAGNDGGTWTGILTLFAPMIAFFMIPTLFKASGTLISGVNNAIASRGKSISGATAGALNKNMKDTLKKKSALTFGDPNTGKFRKTASRFGMGVAGFGTGSQGRMRRASAVGAAFKEKKDLLHHDYEELGISGDNAAMMDKIFTKDPKTGKGFFRPDVDASTRAAVMQMISENGGVEEMSAMYEALRANNDGESYSQNWNHADRDLWNRGSGTTRDKLAKSLPYAVRPDSDRSLGKMDAEGITGLKAAAGKLLTRRRADGTVEEIAGSSHIELGLADIARRASATEGDDVPGMSKPITQDQINDAKLQQQKVLSSMVGIGQSTDRRGRVDAENIKALTRAAQAGLLGEATMAIPGYKTPMNAKQIIKEFIDPSTGQMRVIPESNGSGPLKDPPTV